MVRAFWLAKNPWFNRHATQATLDGVVDTDVDYTSNDAGSSPTSYLQFSSVFFLVDGNSSQSRDNWAKADGKWSVAVCAPGMCVTMSIQFMP